MQQPALLARRGVLRTSSGLLWPILIGAAAAAPRLTRPSALTDAAACPGILESSLALLLRTAPQMPVGTALRWCGTAAAFLALACFARVLHHTTRSIPITALVTAALSLSPLFDTVLSPPTPALVFAAVSCAWIPLLTAGADGRRTAILSCAAVAWLSPPTFMPALLLAIALLATQPSSRWSWMGAPGMVVFLLAGFWVMSRDVTPTAAPVQACLLPIARGEWTGEAGGRALLGAGPALAGLALLGGFRWFTAAPVRPRLSSVVPAVAALALSAGSVPASLLLWTSIWIFAAIGLAELSTAVRDRARLAATLAVGLLLVLLQSQTWKQRGIPAPDPHGHERLSTAEFLRAVSRIPEVTLVTEDASSNLVFRAASPRMHRLGKRPQVLPAGVEAMKAAAPRQYSPVLALQRAQEFLQHRGVQFQPAAPRTPLAATVAIQSCVPVRDTWQDAPSLVHHSRFAFVARDETARGPIAIYFGSGGPLQPRPLGWPGRTTRGFSLVTYTRDARPDLREALEAQGIPADSPLLTSPHVVRLVLWRTPGAPRGLPIDLGRPADAVLTRVDHGGLPLSVELCPSFEYAPSAW